MKKYITTLILCVMAFPIMAQVLWTSASFKTSFGRHWGANADVEYRTHDQLKSSERVTFGLGGEYKHTFFKVDAGYKYMMGHTLGETTRKGNFIPAYWLGRHRIYASVTGKLSVGRFEISLRERYQFTHRLGKWVPKYAADGVTPKDDEWVAPKDSHILRSRLAGEYNIRKCRFTPFVSVELYDNLSRGFAVEKVRYTAGSEYKINKHNRVELFYRFVQGVKSGSDNVNVIGLGYTFKL